MEGEIFENVKYEKAKAIARFNRFRRFAKLWQVFEVVVVLVMLSWWSTNIPAALRFSGEFLFRVAACVCNPHVVFLIGNAIIVALFVLRKQNDAGNISGEVSGDCDDYGEYVEAERRVASASEAEKRTAEEDGGDKEAEVVEDEKRLQIVVAEQLEMPQCEEEVVEPAVAEAEEQIRRFQRTQSERLRREIAVRPHRELRRSETEFRRRVTTSSDAVEELSNEEFKRAVDAFIDKHQRFFKQQKMAELEGLNYNYNKIMV